MTSAQVTLDPHQDENISYLYDSELLMISSYSHTGCIAASDIKKPEFPRIQSTTGRKICK